MVTTAENLTIDDDKSIKSTIEPSILGEFKPPQKSTPFHSFNVDNVEGKLQEKIQHSWWNTGQGENSTADIESEHRFANFSLDYCRYLSETSNNLIRFQEPSTIAEQHVMREILWMFQKPLTCGVFVMDQNNELKIKTNVTIPSCGVVGFLFSIYIMNVILKFCVISECLSLLFGRTISSLYKNDARLKTVP